MIFIWFSFLRIVITQPKYQGRISRCPKAPLMSYHKLLQHFYASPCPGWRSDAQPRARSSERHADTARDEKCDESGPSRSPESTEDCSETLRWPTIINGQGFTCWLTQSYSSLRCSPKSPPLLATSSCGVCLGALNTFGCRRVLMYERAKGPFHMAAGFHRRDFPEQVFPENLSECALWPMPQVMTNVALRDPTEPLLGPYRKS